MKELTSTLTGVSTLSRLRGDCVLQPGLRGRSLDRSTPGGRIPTCTRVNHNPTRMECEWKHDRGRPSWQHGCEVHSYEHLHTAVDTGRLRLEVAVWVSVRRLLDEPEELPLAHLHHCAYNAAASNSAPGSVTTSSSTRTPPCSMSRRASPLEATKPGLGEQPRQPYLAVLDGLGRELCLGDVLRSVLLLEDPVEAGPGRLGRSAPW